MRRGLVEYPALAGPETSWWTKNINMVHLKGLLKKWFLECESLSEGSRLAGLSRFFEI
jgi:hypothetical protein